MQAELTAHMGDDTMVVNAARVSFDKHHDTFVQGEDNKLINYLAKHDHWTPFAHPVAQFRITVPIYVANQLKRHEVGYVLNEVSRRYVDTDPTFEEIKVWRGRPTSSAKQGSSGELEESDQVRVRRLAKAAEAFCASTYREILKFGAAPEQARSILPQSMHTSWYWTGSLYAWARLCRQRLDPHAQAETREIAETISKAMEDLFPVSWAALLDA